MSKGLREGGNSFHHICATNPKDKVLRVCQQEDDVVKKRTSWMTKSLALRAKRA